VPFQTRKARRDDRFRRNSCFVIHRTVDDGRPTRPARILIALCNDLRGSVPRDERSAEAVVDARGDHVDILTDALAVIEHRAECRVIDHRDVAIAHEQMILFERERPVSRERIFAACSDHATPAGLAAAIRDES